jgi:LysM repeat protein
MSTTSTLFAGDQCHVYSVVADDSLWKIANEHHTTMEQIMQQNPAVSNPDHIHVGQKLLICPPRLPEQQASPSKCWPYPWQNSMHGMPRMLRALQWP